MDKRWRCTISAELSLAVLNRKHKMEWLSIKTSRHALAWLAPPLSGIWYHFVWHSFSEWLKSSTSFKDENWTPSHIASTSQTSKNKGKGSGEIGPAEPTPFKDLQGTPPDILFHFIGYSNMKQKLLSLLH